MRKAPAIAVMALLALPAAAAAQGPVADLTGPQQAVEGSPATLTITLSEASTDPVSVDWKTGPPTFLADAPAAEPGVDYVEAAETAEFAPGQVAREIVVQLPGDTLDETGGYFGVELIAARGASPGRTWVAVGIGDDDPTPAASIADAVVAEGAGDAVLPVTRPGVTERGPALYSWSARGGAGAFAIAPTATTAEVRVPISDDALDEPDETIAVELAPAPPTNPWTASFGGPLADGVATVTVVDDDPPAPRRTVVTVTRVRGKVRLGGERLTGLGAPARGDKLDARKGAARIAWPDGRSAIVSGGVVRLGDPGRLVLASRRAAITASEGVRLRGRDITTTAVTAARWSVLQRAKTTRVAVRKGRVKAGGKTLRAGGSRLFRR